MPASLQRAYDASAWGEALWHSFPPGTLTRDVLSGLAAKYGKGTPKKRTPKKRKRK